MWTSESLLRTWDLLFQISMKATSDIFKVAFVWISWWIFIAKTIEHKQSGIYIFLGYFFFWMFTKFSVRKLKLNTAMFSQQFWDGGKQERGGEKGTLSKKKNGCGYQKDSAHLLRVLSKIVKAHREGGVLSLLCHSPIIKTEPYWVRETERCRDCD